ncbi:coiled-coil domain-containing protein [Lysinibacillus sp. RC79]|uniref:coiled-coil domain-containing protein n=1 Tax=Lysinibacillus sp. RC79 TaxID=3156296 RepID=UPI003513A5AE
MSNIYNTNSPVSREERNNVNNTWQDILKRFASLQRQINILAGDQEVEELLQRIEDAINNAYTSVAAAIEENNDATQEAINNVNTSLENALNEVSMAIHEINTAITNADEATADANKATNNANTAINAVNEKVTEATQLIDSLDVLKAQMELLEKQLETAKSDAETATSNANSAAQEVRNAIQDTNTAIANAEGATQKANQAVQDINEAKEDLTQVVNDKITEADTAITNANNATDQADQAAEAIKGWGTATVWNETTQYEKNNIVTDNGSSWQATKANANSKPSTSNENWILLAQRGVDGTGAVSSVNNVLPDENGNVQLNLKQGTVQKVNGKSPDGNGEVTLLPSDVVGISETITEDELLALRKSGTYFVVRKEEESFFPSNDGVSLTCKVELSVGYEAAPRDFVMLRTFVVVDPFLSDSNEVTGVQRFRYQTIDTNTWAVEEDSEWIETGSGDFKVIESRDADASPSTYPSGQTIMYVSNEDAQSWRTRSSSGNHDPRWMKLIVITTKNKEDIIKQELYLINNISSGGVYYEYDIGSIYLRKESKEAPNPSRPDWRWTAFKKSFPIPEPAKVTNPNRMFKNTVKKHNYTFNSSYGKWATLLFNNKVEALQSMGMGNPALTMEKTSYTTSDSNLLNYYDLFRFIQGYTYEMILDISANNNKDLYAIRVSIFDERSSAEILEYQDVIYDRVYVFGNDMNKPTIPGINTFAAHHQVIIPHTLNIEQETYMVISAINTGNNDLPIELIGDITLKVLRDGKDVIS